MGQPVPDLTLELLDGSRASVSDWRGQAVLINFWATWCPPCREEIGTLEAEFRERRDQGLVVLGVNVGESREVVEAFARETGIGYPLLLDPEGSSMTTFRILGLPTSLVVDRDGIVRARHDGQLSRAELEQLLNQVLDRP